ncbi:MAG TPA: transcription termination factor NusA [Syntrophales bacterium]|nr:transcription termination factor NusA [Syntrophales bacterium]HQB31334.1 transcription termination factor NusA [Syntrophales bacterium]HQN78397.1 transcription termination factor NusA [Syntrophales bacterium]HQQ27229.1 transcription termination factor NusA [Syntrophales bacterium]
MMVLPELKRLIEQMGKEKGIDKELIVEALTSAVLSAARKKLGQNLILEVQYNDDVGEIEVFQFKTVVDKVINEDTQISIDEARDTLDDAAELGDSLGVKLDTSSFGRIAVQTARQIVIQKVRDAERDKIYDEYKDRKGEIISGFVQRFEQGSIIVNLGRTEGILPTSEQISRETYKRGDRVRAYVCDVRKTLKGPQIVLSRTHPSFLKSLFELEVPEISEGLIEIVGVAREPGNRSKISVKTREKDIDPVGACVGVRGSRVQSVVQELKGEKIDIVPFVSDPVQYVCNALSPAKVDRVLMYDELHAMEVIVPDDQLSLAIGKNGQNVRLAARLTGWKIDVKSKSRMEKKEEPGAKDLMRLSGMEEKTADLLFREGFKTLPLIASADPEVLTTLSGISKERIQQWVSEAGKLIDEDTAAKEPAS